MKKSFLLLTLSSTILMANPQNINTEFQNFLQQENKDFNNYKKTLDEGFKEYQKSLNEGFKNYKKELMKYWKNPELSTKTTFVEYSKDKLVKKKVDYENNEIEIQVISDNKLNAQRQMALALMKLNLENTKEAFEKNPVLSKVNKELTKSSKLKPLVVTKSVSTEPIVSDMIFNKKPTINEIKTYSIKKVKTQPIQKTPSKVAHSNVYTIKIKLPSRAFLAKAKIYKPEVLKRSKNFNLSPELIYGIIHTESSFNPMARSYVPAFGLMQLVPQTAGADAYKMLYGKRKILTPSYLYNANNNILMGSAYLKKLYYGYMRKIKNPVSRLYCTIAAYNTGAGNVACAFNSTTKDYKGRTKCIRSRGDYNIIKASDKINKLTPNQVYNQLLLNLRFDEAKNYLKRVSKRMNIYHKAFNTNAL